MKLLKWISGILLGLLLISILILAGSVWMEARQQSYLEIQENENLQLNSYLIRNVNLIPMTTDTVVSGVDVKIINGLIEDIGVNLTPDELAVIEGNGGYLMPGLVDMHVHLWDKFELGLYLASGVTTVRSLLGMPWHLKVRDAINEGKIIGPMFYTASPQLSGPDDGDILKKPVGSTDEARQLVKEYYETGYDYIKTYNLLPEDMFDVVLDEAEALGIPVVAHPSFRVDYDYHFDPRITTVEHTEDIFQQPLKYQMDYQKLDEVVAGYAASGQSHCPTLTVFHNLTEIYNRGEHVLNSEESKYINPFIAFASHDYERHTAIRESDSLATQRINEQHQFHIEAVRRLHAAGVNIVCGTDAGIVNTVPGLSIHQELEFYLQAGMSNYEALQTATVNPGKVYPAYTNFGTVEPGKMANLILSSGNPLHDLKTLQSPQRVFVMGRSIDQEHLEEMKEKAHHRKNFVATMLRVFYYILWEK